MHSKPNLDGHSDIQFKNLADTVENRKAGFASIYKEIRKRLDVAFRKRDEQYQVGQEVWRKNYALSNAANYFSAKLGHKYIGPYRVRKRVGYNTYELEDDNGNKKGIWHSKGLKSVNTEEKF